MGAQRFRLLLSLMLGFLLTLEGQAQDVTFDLDVQVVLDTVLYDGYQGAEDFVPAGFRRYKIYATLPSPGALMLGPAADNTSDPVIPAFGFDATCGCYNWESIFVPDGYNNGPRFLCSGPRVAIRYLVDHARQHFNTGNHSISGARDFSS